MEKKRIVVKIGSSSLTDERGSIAQEKLEDHVEALTRLKKAGHEVILVSSVPAELLDVRLDQKALSYGSCRLPSF